MQPSTDFIDDNLLKAMALVKPSTGDWFGTISGKCVPGPKGGYKPTATAYETLEIQQMDEPAAVPLEHKGERLEDIIIEEIDLSSVHHPELCRAEVHIQGSIDAFHEG